MTNRKYLLFLLLLPCLAHAEGQEALAFFLDLIDFVKVFSVWALAVLLTNYFIKKYQTKKTTRTSKMIFLFGTALIALFVWSMIKSDSDPWHGPIDSIVHRKENEAFRIQDSINIYQGNRDSTIDETLASADTNKIGIYIWLNHQRIFVRKHTQHLGSQRREDSLTMAIVRGWKYK
jgi:hypothetical protein